MTRPAAENLKSDSARDLILTKFGYTARKNFSEINKTLGKIWLQSIDLMWDWTFVILRSCVGLYYYDPEILFE